MQNRIVITSLLGVFWSLSLTAGTMSNITTQQLSSLLYVGGYGGYGTVSGGYKNDGNVAQGRFTLGIHAKQYKLWMLGGEVGIQSGNTMRLATSSAVIDSTTDLLPQATLKPFLDLLLTVKGQIRPDKPLYYTCRQ